MGTQLLERHLLVNRDTVTYDMQVGLPEVNDLFSLGVFDICIPNIPFLRYNPIVDLGSSSDFAYRQGDMLFD
jgi:hypothetical protein